MYRADPRPRRRKELRYAPDARRFGRADLAPLGACLLAIFFALAMLEAWSTASLRCDRHEGAPATCSAEHLRLLGGMKGTWPLDQIRDIEIDGKPDAGAAVRIRIGFGIDSGLPYSIDIVGTGDNYLDGPRAYEAQAAFRRFQRDPAAPSFRVWLGPTGTAAAFAVLGFLAPLGIGVAAFVAFVVHLRGRRKAYLVVDEARGRVEIRSGVYPRDEVEDVVLESTAAMAEDQPILRHRLSLRLRDGRLLPINDAYADAPSQRWEELLARARALLERA